MHTRFEWDVQSDRRLVELADEGVAAGRIAAMVSTADNIATAASVRRRCAVLGITIQRAGVWTPALDARLVELWGREPKLTLKELTRWIGAGVDFQAVSRRAGVLGLPSRYASVEARPQRAATARALEFRSPVEGGKLHASLTTPKPRVKIAPDETPCPYIEPETGLACGVVVDRRPDGNGVKPSQYCACHRPRVLPLSRGLMGVGVVATYGKGARFG